MRPLGWLGAAPAGGFWPVREPRAKPRCGRMGCGVTSQPGVPVRLHAMRAAR